MPGKSSKATLRRPIRKGRNRCAIAFGLGARGEELGFCTKGTWFLSLRTSFGSTRVLLGGARSSFGGPDSFFFKFISKLGKTTSFSRNFGKNNQSVVPKELPSFPAASCRWLESAC